MTEDKLDTRDKRLPIVKKIKHLLFPPICVSCKELFDPFVPSDTDFALCDECFAQWLTEEKYPCSCCNKRISECSNIPEILWDKKVISFCKLVPYVKDNENVTDRAVYELKEFPNKRNLRFLSYRLWNRLISEFDKLKIRKNGAKLAFVFSPRSKKSVKEYGFDQSELLTRLVAGYAKNEGFDSVYLPKAIKRIGGTHQKLLDAEGRIKNARRSFASGKEAKELNGRYVILIDDIFTTGATLSECSEILKKQDIKGIICATVCKTENQDQTYTR